MMERTYTLGSLFDGIGGFPLAAGRHGIKPLWASEIEPSCIEITKRQFPDMLHLGSVTDIHGGEIPPVDIISFGSPCQDMSVAGTMSGLDGSRSRLFFEAVRIIYEMRAATYGVYPTFILWENVPGAFSSGHGEDFRRVLEEITKTEVSMPKSGKWGGSGMVRTDLVEVAWRQFDAQYWGVPQRRKRIYLVADFGNRRAAEVLFKSESLLGYTAQGGKEEQGAAPVVKGCSYSAESAGFIGRACAEAYSIGYEAEKSPCLRSGLIPDVLCAAFSGQNSITAAGVEYDEKTAPCLRTKSIPNCLQGCFEMTHADEVLRKSDGGICPTLQARMGTGGNQIPLVFDTAYCIAGNTIDRQEKNGGNGKGVNENVSFTLNTIDRHAVAFGVPLGFRPENTDIYEELATTICNGTCPGFHQGVLYAIDYVAFNQGENAKCDFEISDKGISTTLIAKGPSAVCCPALKFVYVVRRLTPRECERLQGFPDDWTRYRADGGEIKDTPRYKALGNSIAVPCAERVFIGILDTMKGQKNE